MNDINRVPIAFPSADERTELVLEFQRAAAKLVRAGLLSQSSSTRFVLRVNQGRRKAEESRHRLAQLIVDVLVAVEDGTLTDGVHVRRSETGMLAVRAESVARALFRAGRSQLTARATHDLLRFGHAFFPLVVVSTSERVCFGSVEDRFRTFVLDLAKAQEFVGIKPAVPSR
ncbi:MAG: hypothetical protein HY898_03770 [Deltaproteobacteria bacterium]|nr:hypothetical protein [Deltaproteobacteria bacterium]